MPFSREQLDRIRQSNRETLGFSGTPKSEPLSHGMGDVSLLGAVGPIQVSTAFPAFTTSYDPSQPAPATPPTTGSAVSDFLLRSVIRPTISIPNLGFQYDPTNGAPDYSGVARVVTIGAGVAVVATIAWVLLRAFAPRRNPRRVRYHVYRRSVAA